MRAEAGVGGRLATDGGLLPAMGPARGTSSSAGLDHSPKL
jgi:hypothetical protein